MIEVNDVSKVFKLTRKQRKEFATDAREHLAVNHISFSCKQGRVFSLLGPNGAGKTTTLRMISTIFKPSSGSIQINGYDTNRQGQQARRELGFLTGSTGLYARLTPNEVLDYFGKLYGVEKTELERRKEELYERLGMKDFIHKRIGRLSTGMKQKTSIARTMIHDPSVVVFDEPTSGLDVITAEHIIELIRDCKDKGKTVIFSSHIMSEVDLLCDDLAIIHKGNLLYQGTMDEFRAGMSTDNLTQEFINTVEKAPVLS